VRFWDTSALVPLCLREASTDAVRTLLRADPEIVVWWGTRVELAAALARRAREDGLEIPDPASRAQGDDLASGWAEIAPTEPVRMSAERLVVVHPLRSQDALQLAAALVWCGGHGPRGRGFVCLDERLRLAAAREGFDVLPAVVP
jgi:hypothetical protein